MQTTHARVFARTLTLLRRPRRGGPAALLALALLAAVPAVPAGAAPGSQPKQPARIDRALRDAAAKQPGGRVPVLIQRKNASAAKSAVQKHGGQVRREIKFGGLTVADVPASKLDALAAEGAIVRLAYDAPMQVQANQKDQPTGQAQQLNESKLQTAFNSVVGSPALWSHGLRGAGVGVAILDSGIKDDRADFLGSVAAKNGSELPSTTTRVVKKVAIALDNQGSPIDDNGHGTWVAGIIASRGWADPLTSNDDNRYVGVAPDANLINVKVSDRFGMARTSDVIAGLEWVVANKDAYNIRVANISMVSAVAESYTTSLLDAAVEMAWFKGITVVVSAGNAGADSMRFPPANDPYVIVVGATDDKATREATDDQVAWFSSYGTTQDGFVKPDVVAPGRRIVSTLSSKQAPLAELYPNRVIDAYHISLSGTSGAAPVVSGIVADLVQTAKLLNISLSPDQVKWVLQKTARPVAGAGAGAGYASLLDAASFAYANPTAIGRANQTLKPNLYLAAAFANASSGGIAWDNVSWENVSWENVSWENVSWENVSWENVSWENVSWENVSWENVSWENVAGD